MIRKQVLVPKSSHADIQHVPLLGQNRVQSVSKFQIKYCEVGAEVACVIARDPPGLVEC